ncbi:MAG: helix-turn-helix domain-containing protein [Rudanella sp.]|nr:helix-turn-helix domain-containing protein [Rudanella sp.]
MKKSLHSKQHKILLELLYQFRVNSNLTQSELATCLQVPQSFVSKYENGERRLDLMELESICTCVNVELIDLIREYQQRLHETKS